MNVQLSKVIKTFYEIVGRKRDLKKQKNKTKQKKTTKQNKKKQQKKTLR